ncbi:Gfo/Idh/MocA family oxidoreductase [Halobacillus salinarum]|uniref:Gfo/Idh/MocA family oxidoreductase n=1 Tax=Halobacillus salinarum TaxID=2932257 RepID=A0ABY4ELW2_9BACI|nr:Gfo/Idh/MocA family oxidoreductase [Halobacillus salinarum]UOQ45443.1 Gfo/Idh/MocA family oxidoreductase [Halobacillus salinarum]
MKIGIISFAHGHAYSYAEALNNRPNVELAGVFDEDASRGKNAAEQFGAIYYDRLDALLETDVTAVIVTSENAKHLEHVSEAAKAKKHILCEKPMATSVEDAEKMIEVCRENEVILQIAFPVRFSTPVLRAKELIAAGELGDLLAVKATNRGTNPGGWFIQPELSGGGAVLDHTVHVVDLLRWFMGEEVNEVYAEIGTHFTTEAIDDSGILSMSFTNGVSATLDCSWSRNDAYPTWGDVTLEIVGTKGTLSVHAFDQKIDVYSNRDGVNWEFWGDDMDESLVADFLEAVQDEREPFITGRDGLKALEVALAAYQSAADKATVRY